MEQVNISSWLYEDAQRVTKLWENTWSYFEVTFWVSLNLVYWLRAHFNAFFASSDQFAFLRGPSTHARVEPTRVGWPPDLQHRFCSSQPNPCSPSTSHGGNVGPLRMALLLRSQHLLIYSLESTLIRGSHMPHLACVRKCHTWRIERFYTNYEVDHGATRCGIESSWSWHRNKNGVLTILGFLTLHWGIICLVPPQHGKEEVECSHIGGGEELVLYIETMAILE